MTNLLKPFGSQSFLIGLGVAAAAYFIGPHLKEALKPAAAKGAQGFFALSGKTKEAISHGKEKLSDIVFEKEQGAKVKAEGGELGALLKELKDERVQSNKMLEDLRKTISDLRGDISSIRNDGTFQEG